MMVWNSEDGDGNNGGMCSLGDDNDNGHDI